MNQLENALTPIQETITLGINSLTESFDDFLRRFYFQQNNQLIIRDATVQAEGIASVVSGTADFLGSIQLPVTARFSWNEEGEVVALVRYQLPQTWTFTKAFPELPGGEELFKHLLFSDGELVITNQVQTHPDHGVIIEPGINFLGELRSTPGIGSLLLGAGQLIQGCIRIPQDDAEIFLPNLQKDMIHKTYPWDHQDSLVGIHLSCALKRAFSVGELALKDGVFHFYTPLSHDWSMKNDLFQPLVGVSSKLELGDLTEEIIGSSIPGTDCIYFEARLQGASLGNLAKLTGQKDLFSSFPAPLKKALKGAKKLELTQLCFGVAFGKSGVSVSSFVLEVAAPGVQWDLWKDHLSVSEMGCRLIINTPFSKPSLDVTFWGNTTFESLPLRLIASSAGNWIFMASLQEAQTLPLEKIIGKKLPAELSVDSMLLAVGVDSGVRFTGACAGEPGWKIKVGSEQLTVEDLLFDLSCSWDRKVTGSIGGTVKLGGASLKFHYAVPGDWLMRADIPKVSFKDLCKRFGKGVQPSFNPNITNASVMVSKESFQLSGSVGNDTFMFEGGKKGFAAGMELNNPELGAVCKELKPFDKAVQLQDLTVVAANYDAPKFRFSPMKEVQSQHNVPQISGGLAAGLNIHAIMKLDTKELKLLRKVLGLDPKLDVAVQVSKNPRLFFEVDTKINKWPFRCDVGFALEQGSPELFCEGILLAKIQKKPCSFDVALSVVKSGFYFGGTMEGSVKVDTVTVSNLSLMIGMNWGGIPSLGIAGELDLPNISSSVALLFDANDPSKSLIAGAISDLTLADVVKTLAQVKKLPEPMGKVLSQVSVKGTDPFILPAEVAEALDTVDHAAISTAFRSAKVSIPSSSKDLLLVVQDPGKRWQLTDIKNNMTHYQLVKTPKGIRVSLEAQIYMAPQASQIGTQRFEQGFLLNASLKVLGLQWTSTVNINARKGISIDSSLANPLTVYNRNFFCVSNAKGDKGPLVSMSTFNQPRHKEAKFRKPHFYLSGKMVLMGLDVAEAFVEVGQSGLIFKIEENTGLKVGCKSFSGSFNSGFDLEGNFTSLDHFGVDGNTHVKIKGKIALAKLGHIKGVAGSALKELGTVSINLAFTGNLGAGYAKKKAYAKVSGSFKFLGVNVKLKEKLNVDAKAIDKLGDLVYGEIKEVAKDVSGTAEKWAKAVKNGIVEGVKDVEQAGRVLKNVFRKPAKDAAKVLNSVGHSVDDVGKVLKNTYKQSGKDAAKVFKSLGKDSKQVAKTLRHTFKMGAKDVGNVMKDTFKIDKKDLEKALKGAGFASKEVSKALDHTFKDVGKKLKKTFHI